MIERERPFNVCFFLSWFLMMQWNPEPRLHAVSKFHVFEEPGSKRKNSETKCKKWRDFQGDTPTSQKISVEVRFSARQRGFLREGGWGVGAGCHSSDLADSSIGPPARRLRRARA
jgi:hypothetical protein